MFCEKSSSSFEDENEVDKEKHDEEQFNFSEDEYGTFPSINLVHLPHAFYF